MKSFFHLTTVSTLFLLFPLYFFSQEIRVVNFPLEHISSNSFDISEVRISAKEFQVFEMDIAALKNELIEVNRTSGENNGFITQIQLPHPDGETYWYNVKRNTTMSPGLEEKFPDIQTYDAYGVEIPAKAKIDITHKGFHAMIMQPSVSTIFIDPAFEDNVSHYMVYHRKDFSTSKELGCLTTNELRNDSIINDEIIPKNYVSCELRTYRLALAATVEYTNFHGGTVSDAIAGQVTTMNRVNGIYERDLAVTMTIIPNNDLLIYSGDPNNDPFTNGDAFQMLQENQTNTDEIIGSANFDIGHVFGTNSGGVAGLGVICLPNQKARGVTGSNAPINDPFDVDYVAHEMGHQFGANHTQNNGCNRNNATAMEPGSASTILGYAGICQPNVQGSSDDYFHGVSLQEMGNRISVTSCEAKTALTNNPPVIDSTNANVFIPAGTPFALTAFANDSDGDVLTYCWEQMNNQVSVQPPVETASVGPNFRSFLPSTEPTRYFPSLANLVSNNSLALRWEVVPAVGRTMNFRVTVRDQALGVAGCLDYMDVTVTAVEEAGPFVVLYPSDQGIVWTGFDDEVVTWNVANTDVAPIYCEEVDIFLSVDGGLSYPITLASNVPNTGAANVLVPNLSTTTARVMVKDSKGTFFDVSDNNFEIIRLTNDFILSVNPIETKQICSPEEISYTVHIDSLDGFNAPVELAVNGLPDGIVASFEKQTIIPADSSQLDLTINDETQSGIYFITIEATSSTGTKSREIELVVNASKPSAIVQLTSAKATGNEPLEWEASTEVNVSYDIQIATDSDFNDIIEEASSLTSTTYNPSFLTPTSSYYWRVRAVTACGTSPWTAPYFDEADLIIYPNPTSDFLTLSWVGGVTKIEVSDATGKIVERKNVKQMSTTILDLTKYSAGVYHISVFTEKDRFVYDVIKL